jgi:hypothetical protein
MLLKFLLKLFILALIKTLSFGSLYFIQPYLYNIYINTYYIDKLNILFIGLFLIKFYISFNNYIKIFQLLENIYSTIRYIFLLYSIIINCDYRLYLIDDLDDSQCINNNLYNNQQFSNNLDDNQSNKKTQITYIKHLLILYLYTNLSFLFKFHYNIIIFTEKMDNTEKKDFEQLYKYINYEIQQININNNINHTNILLIELLILKNLSNLKKLNYINFNDYNLLVKSFKKLQNLIKNLYKFIENYNIYYYVILITTNILYINIISIYIQYLNSNIYSFLYTLLINFIIICLDDIINTYLNIFNILSKIFDFEKYLKELHNEIYILNYLYPVDNEYSL